VFPISQSYLSERILALIVDGKTMSTQSSHHRAPNLSSRAGGEEGWLVVAHPDTQAVGLSQDAPGLTATA
jgi:hypothetical protein